MLGPDRGVEVLCEDVAETGAHDHHIVLVEVGGSGLALAAET